jgi:hypothetical protein
MQKKEDLQNSFKSRKDKPALSVADIDRIAEEVEKPAVVAKAIPKPMAKPVLIAPIIEEEVAETIKTSLDFPVSVYEDMRISLFKKRRSMKDYIVDLVRKDLYGS